MAATNMVSLDPLHLLTGGVIIVWADKYTPAVCHETIAASGPLG